MTHTKLRSLLVTLLLPICFSVHAEKTLNFSTWNLEWLSSTPSDKFPQSQRLEKDYAALATHFASMDSDIVAFQEVNDEKALRKVIGQQYRIYFSTRRNPEHAAHQFTAINQYTGFAVREGIPVIEKESLQLDTSHRNKLRFASYVVISPTSDTPIHALSVHLKARCSGAFRNNDACRTLKRQGKALNHWIREREARGERYMILGDFNHNMSYPKDWLWEIVSQDSTAKLATKETKATCKVRSRNNPSKTHQFRSLIDHVITSDQISVSKIEQRNYKTDDLFRYKLSDHCPITLTK